MNLVLVAHKRNIRIVMAALLEKPIIKAAIGMVMDEQGRVLVTQRAAHLSKAGYWEFPGGKLEQYESPELALIRELHEEVGLEILSYDYLGEVHHEYDTYHVILYGYLIRRYRGEARRCESQPGMKWLTLDELKGYQFPEANRQLIEVMTNNWR